MHHVRAQNYNIHSTKIHYTDAKPRTISRLPFLSLFWLHVFATKRTCSKHLQKNENNLLSCPEGIRYRAATEYDTMWDTQYHHSIKISNSIFLYMLNKHETPHTHRLWRFPAIFSTSFSVCVCRESTCGAVMRYIFERRSHSCTSKTEMYLRHKHTNIRPTSISCAYCNGEPHENFTFRCFFFWMFFLV